MEDLNEAVVENPEPVTSEPAQVSPVEEKPKEKKKKKGCLGKALLILLIVLVVLGVLGYFFGMPLLQKVFNVYTPFEATQEKLAELAPIPAEEKAAVDAMEGYSKDDTWAVYVYLIGADLESVRMDNLSPLTAMMTADEAKKIAEKESERTAKQIRTFVEEVTSQGVELPAVLYQTYANKTDAAGEITADDPDAKGFASADFGQMISVPLPKNVKLVIETGGAKRWQNTMINPNRTQRFLVDQDGVHEVYSVPAVNVSTVDSLVDFLKYSIENYPADHTMALFWNHGGGFTGYGQDEIFGSIFSNRDLHDAFEKAVGYDPEHPFFEAIGFDACLMASAEAAHEFYGFAKYLLASEETEPGTGWNHESWLGALAENPGMNGAQLGKVVTDSYLEASLAAGADLGYASAGTFSVLDLAEAEATYQAYGELAKQMLKRSIADPSTLAEIGAAANRSVFYAGNSYKVYNTLDLGMFMDGLPEYFAAGAAEVKTHLKNAVLYHRGSGYLDESQGLSMYYPARIEGMGGLSFFLQYVNDVSDNQDINALYYYKVAGCLNDELQAYVSGEGYGEAKKLDFKQLSDITRSEVVFGEDGNFSFSVTDEQAGLIQDATLVLAKYDKESEDLTYYGEDHDVVFDQESKTFTSTFDGTWINFDDQPLATEVIDASNEYVLYTVPMTYNLAVDVDFMLSYHFEDQRVDFIGIRTEEDAGNTVGRNLVPIKENSLYAPRYKQSNLEQYSVTTTDGTPSTISGETVFAEKPLADGSYLAYIQVEDLRSDVYYSPIIEYTIKGGKIIDKNMRDDFYAYDNQK